MIYVTNKKLFFQNQTSEVVVWELKGRKDFSTTKQMKSASLQACDALKKSKRPQAYRKSCFKVEILNVFGAFRREGFFPRFQISLSLDKWQTLNLSYKIECLIAHRVILDKPKHLYKPGLNTALPIAICRILSGISMAMPTSLVYASLASLNIYALIQPEILQSPRLWKIR